MNKVTEPYWVAWLFWHLYRRRKGPRYAVYWAFRKKVRALPDGGLMVDCGANVGDVSRLFLDKNYTVHAFEPDPDARAVLSRRFGGDANLVIHPQAVSAEAGRMTLHRIGAGRIGGTISSSLVRRDIHSSDDGVEVEVVDLFAFMESLGRRVDILKLDVEGAEAPILEKMLTNRYDRKIGHLFAETHEKFSAGLAERLAKIRGRVEELGIENIDLDWN